MKKLRILIVEDDQLMLEGLRSIINAQDDMEVWGTALNGVEALKLLESSRPDFVLMDIRMPGLDGISVIQKIREQDEKLPILVLTMYLEDDYIIGALSSGANGYLLKGVDTHQLMRSIREVANDHFILPWEIASRIIKQTIHKDKKLTHRTLSSFFQHNPLFSVKEQEILIHILNRLPNKEIAEKMFLSEGTIKNSISGIYKKLKVKKRSDAIKKIEALIHNEGFNKE